MTGEIRNQKDRRKILIFCSNPVNGGTAEVFAETSKELKKMLPVFDIIPCVDKNNTVKVYETIPDLRYLPVVSQIQALGEARKKLLLPFRIIRRIIRDVQYESQKRRNKKIMMRFLFDNNIDTVLIHNGGYIGDDLCNELLQTAKKIGVRSRIMVLHSDFSKNLFRKILCIRYDKMLDECATQLVTVSNYTKNRIRNNSYIKKEIKVIYNGLDFDETQSVDEKKKILSYKETVLHIGMVGNFQRNKGQDEYLKAISIIEKKYKKEFQAYIIGNIYDEDYFEKCKNLIEEYSLKDKVKLLQGIGNAKEYYGLFDITCVPSLYDESFGLVALESMKNGTPVVGFDCGGIPEVVQNNRDGYIVETGNNMKMADAVLELMIDDDKRIQFGKNAQQDYEEKFTRERMINEYIKLFYE